MRNDIEIQIDAIHITTEFLFGLVSQRIGQLLLENRNRVQSSLPEVQRLASGKRKALAEMEVASNTRSNGSMRKAKNSKASKHKVTAAPQAARAAKASKASKSYWSKMTPEQRSAEIRRRRRITVERESTQKRRFTVKREQEHVI